jgi:NAD(P)-dependent dehydrogenase (short-subunit alcohol dehydrogenase family)
VSTVPVELTASTVVVTGASSGVGLATARAFAGGGARLVLAARTVERLDRAAEDVRALGAEVLAVPTGVTDAAQVEQLAQAAVGAFGRSTRRRRAVRPAARRPVRDPRWLGARQRRRLRAATAAAGIGTAAGIAAVAGRRR